MVREVSKELRDDDAWLGAGLGLEEVGMYVCMYVGMYVMYVCDVCMYVCMYVGIVRLPGGFGEEGWSQAGADKDRS